MSQPNKLRRWLPKGALLLVIAVAAFLVGKAAVDAVRNQRNGAVCRENLKQIGLALHQYHEKYGSFPPCYIADPAGKPMHSWRVLLLPFLGQEELYQRYRFDEPWNGPHNRQLGAEIPDVYAYPWSDRQNRERMCFLGVVSPWSVWPGPHATAIKNITDGTSNTLVLLEVANSNVHWMEPRELVLDEALGRTKSADALTPSSGRGGSFLGLYADGFSVRPLSPQVDKYIFGGLLSTGTTRVFGPIPWKQSSGGSNAAFRDIVNADTMIGTTVAAHWTAPIEEGKSCVWCGTYQLSWNVLVDDVIQEPVRFVEPNPLAELLNRREFTGANLAPESYRIAAGRCRPEDVVKLKQQLDEAFPANTFDSKSLRGGPDDCYAFAFLKKSLPFEFPFDEIAASPAFQFAGQSSNVRYFGYDPFAATDATAKSNFAQVVVLDYRDDDDFVLRLLTKQRDSIVLAKVAPAKTLKETFDAVRQRIDATKKMPGFRAQMERNERLYVPELNFSTFRDFQELAGKRLANRGWNSMAGAFQVIRFQLDRKGAELESWGGEIVTPNGHDELQKPPKPRNFIFDKPFLVYLQESPDKEPYLVIWVGNDELLVPLK